MLDGELLDLNNSNSFVYPIEIMGDSYAQTKNFGAGVPGTSGVSDIVAFRGDSRPEDFIFQNGFTTKGANTDLPSYVFNNIPSQWVGTSKSPMSANRFATEGANKNLARSGQGVGYLYTVRVKEGNDVNVALGHDHKFKHEHEVITSGNGIVPEDIMGVQKVDQNGNPIGGFIKNPGFKKA